MAKPQQEEFWEVQQHFHFTSYIKPAYLLFQIHPGAKKAALVYSAPRHLKKIHSDSKYTLYKYTPMSSRASIRVLSYVTHRRSHENRTNHALVYATLLPVPIQ